MSSAAQQMEFANTSMASRRAEIVDLAAQLEMPVPVHIGNGIFACVATISPAIADLILSCNHIPNNRNKKPTSIKIYSDDMARGRWRLGHQGIAFNQHDQFFDGQNRLHSCIRAGVSFTTVVFFNVHESAMVNTDTGQVRNATDAAKILGVTIDNASVSSRLVAAARVIARGTSSEKATMEFQMDLLRHLREPLIFLHSNFPSSIKSITIGPVLGAIGRAFYFVDHERLSAFCSVLKTGYLENESTDIAAGLLYRFLCGTNAAGGQNQREIYFKAISAIEKFARRQKITKLYAESEDIYELPLAIKLKLGAAAGEQSK